MATSCSEGFGSCNRAVAGSWSVFGNNIQVWRHVRKVLVLATVQSLVHGASLETISKFGVMFGRASHAKLHLFGARATDGHDISCRVDSTHLLAAIGESFSALRKVDIEASNISFGIDSSNSATLSEGAVSVYKTIAHLDISSCSELVLLDVPMPALTTLVLDVFCSNVAHCTKLVRQQSGNLENLQISHIKASDCLAVLLDSHGRQTVYPRLKRLKLDVLGAFSADNGIERSRALMRSAFTEKSPLFPEIAYISCGSFYPFADNIIWQGAERTLKSLVIAADNILTGWLFPENKSDTAFPGPLAKCLRLQNLEVRIITRAAITDTRTQAIHNRIIAVVVAVVHIKRVCLCYPNSHTVEFKK